MNVKLATRLTVLVFALFPALWGWLGLLNDVSDWNDTVTNAVKPLIDMTNTYGNPWQTWRAITVPWAAPIALFAIVAVETLAGIFGTLGLVLMLINFFGPADKFNTGKAWMMVGCIFAVLIWGVGFMVIAGDWFLAWEAKTMPLSTQLGAMVYFLPNALGLIVAMLHRED